MRWVLMASLVLSLGCQETNDDGQARDGGTKDASAVEEPDLAVRPDTGTDAGSNVLDAGEARDMGDVPDGGAPLQPVGDLPEPLLGFSATVLQDGRLLVAGGRGTATSAGETWLLDLATLSFSSGPALDPPRIGHSANLLPDGRVLIAGGYVLAGGGLRDNTDSAVIFDPATDTFAATDSMSEAQCCHQSIWLDAGPHAGKLLFVGGGRNSERVLALEVFDPVAESFELIGSELPEIRDGAAIVKLNDGRILIAGGATQTGTANIRQDAYLYDPVSNAFALTAGDMDKPRAGLQGFVLSDGSVLLLPGADRTEQFNDCQIYDPVAQSFSPGPVIASGRTFNATARLEDGRVFLLGGRVGGELVDSVEFYEEGSGFADHPNRLHMPLGGPRATPLPDGTLFMLGGQSAQGFLVGGPRIFYP